MSAEDWYYLGGFQASLWPNGGHRTYLTPVIQAVGRSAQDVGNFAILSQNYYALSAGILTTMMSISGGTLGVGTEGLDVSLNALQGSAAFVDIEQIVSRRPVVADLNYQIQPQDFWNALLLTTSGARTYTLPLWSDMLGRVPPLLGKNRSGAALTINRAGTDTIDGAASSLTVPTGSSYEIYLSDTAGLWESRIFA